MLKKIISITMLICLLPVLFINGVILLDSLTHPNEIPSFFGWKPFIVLSNSMETEISAGDIVVIKETNSFNEGDIISFKKSENEIVTHRIIKKEEVDGKIHYITKGDNNNAVDLGYVLEEQIEGKYHFKISRLGNLAMFIQTPIGLISSLSIPVIFLMTMQFIEFRKSIDKLETKEGEEKNE